MFKKKIKPFFQGSTRNILTIFVLIGMGAMFYGYKYDISIFNLGLLIFLLTLTGLTGFYGIMIEYQHQRYKTYLSFLMIKIGSWKPLPLLSKIMVVPYRRFARGNTGPASIYEKLFIIKLIPAEGNEAIIASMGYYGDLILEADTLSKELGVPVAEDTS